MKVKNERGQWVYVAPLKEFAFQPKVDLSCVSFDLEESLGKQLRITQNIEINSVRYEVVALLKSRPGVTVTAMELP